MRKSTAQNKKPPAETPAQLERRRALHALNRLTFGPRPGEVDKVLAKGVDSWVEDQLHPESIDDGALGAHLSAYRALTLAAARARANVPHRRHDSPGHGRKAPDAHRSIAETHLRSFRRETQTANGATGSREGRPSCLRTPPRNRRRRATQRTEKPSRQKSPSAEPTPQEKARAFADSLLELPNNKRMEALMKAPPEELINFPDQLTGDQRNRLNAGFSPRERETLRALSNPVGVVSYELQQAKVVRATFSERQLQEVMTDFWINHFNVYLYKSNQAPIYTVSYERDVIRPRALGKFRDLLVATAQSPAMLNYLDNWLSIGPHSVVAEKK